MTPHEKWVTVRKLVGGSVFRNPSCNLSEWDFADGQTPPTEEEVEAEFNAQEYARNRKIEYPPMEDQLDYIYHNGIEKWKKDIIGPVKTKYPKG